MTGSGPLEFYNQYFQYRSLLSTRFPLPDSLPVGRIIGVQPADFLKLRPRQLRYVGTDASALLELLAKTGVASPLEDRSRFCPAVIRQFEASQTVDLRWEGLALTDDGRESTYGVAVHVGELSCSVALGLYDFDEHTLIAPPPQDFGSGPLEELDRAWQAHMPYSLSGRPVVPV